MLGRLLHLGSGGAPPSSSQPQMAPSQPTSSLDSVQEDTHTRNLLYPDVHALYQHLNDQVFPLSSTPAASASASSANNFDCDQDVDLDVRDVRVLIMQDTLGPVNASLLFDSRPVPPAPPTPNDRGPTAYETRRTPGSSRKGSLGQPSTRPVLIQADSPQLRQGAFDRRGSVHSRTHSTAETEAQRAAREYREELATFSSCIFGNSELMAYKGTSTKVHVVPSEVRSLDHVAAVIGDGRSSIGRSTARSSKLSQSFSTHRVSPSLIPSAGPSLPRQSEKKKVLITRLFPVNLPSDDSGVSTTPHSRFSDEGSAFPFPTSGDETNKKSKIQPRQRRTPMYAVVLVVQLPSARISSGATPKSMHRESSSFTNDQDFFPSSYGSGKPSWSMAGSTAQGDMTDSTYSVDMEDRIDSLTQHWDIIIRTLTHLQSVVATTISSMLKHADIASPEPNGAVPPTTAGLRNQQYSDRRWGETPRPKAPKSGVKLLSLWPKCLATDVEIAACVNLSRRRIVTGLKASRVVTGQGRWGIWRDEAIWTSKWASDSFLYNVLTGFLATHTDWLQALCPPSHRRRYFRSRQGRSEEDLSLPSRTIIISEDKMAARRLVFLLAAFLPANQQLTANRAHRPSTSVSASGYSQSPPTYIVPVLREESLRRKLNKRTNARRVSHSRTGSQSNRSSGVPAQLAHLSIDPSQQRRASDAASIRTSSIAMPTSNDLTSRKSSVATTTTIMPESTTPHFSMAPRAESFRRVRLDSDESVATEDLRRTLKRGESSGHMSTLSSDTRSSQGSKWGSVISGLWGPRRYSTDRSSPQSQRNDPQSPVRSPVKQMDKLSSMVREASLMEDPSLRINQSGAGVQDLSAARDNTRNTRPSFTSTYRAPAPNGAFDSPVKTSINEEDGIIDVDVPFPDYIASFESAISSPSSSGYLSTPGPMSGLDAFEHFARSSTDADQPLNAAGWLNNFHPDFVLQAIPPQHDLIKQVQDTLRAEPTPMFQRTPIDTMERWVDVGSVLLVDTTTNTITQMLHRRLVRVRQFVDRSSSNHPGFPSIGTPHTPSVQPYETQLDEEWIEKTLSKPEEHLAQAMEKVLNVQLGVRSDAVSTRRRPRSGVWAGGDGEDTIPEYPEDHSQLPSAPRAQCKTVVLSALEDIIRDVVGHDEEHSPKTDKAPTTFPDDDSVLRSAVQKWMLDLDATEA